MIRVQVHRIVIHPDTFCSFLFSNDQLSISKEHLYHQYQHCKLSDKWMKVYKSLPIMREFASQGSGI